MAVYRWYLTIGTPGELGKYFVMPAAATPDQITDQADAVHPGNGGWYETDPPEDEIEQPRKAA